MPKNKTISGIKLKSNYAKNKPGDYPFTSGIYPNMYRTKLWTMRQYAGFSSAQKSNERYRYLLKQGVRQSSLAPLFYCFPIRSTSGPLLWDFWIFFPIYKPLPRTLKTEPLAAAPWRVGRLFLGFYRFRGITLATGKW